MKKTFAAIALLTASTATFATQETFTTAGTLNCAQVSICSQPTTDGLFTLKFVPTYPTSAPSATGFNVNQPAIEIYSNGPSGLMDMSILQLNLTGSNYYNGMNFLGTVQLETLDASGTTWRYVTQWPTYIGSSRGVYVMFRGLNASAPLIRGVKAVRLTGILGATSFKIGMINAAAY